MLFLDTHVIVWMYDRRTDLFSSAAIDAIEAGDLMISPIVRLELEYLFETNRTTVRSRDIIEYLSRAVQLKEDSSPFAQIVERATRVKWTRDPFDRILTAHADLLDAPLLTKDRRIHSYYASAVW